MSRIAPIQYLERPVTADERGVAALMEKAVQAIIAKDVNLLVSAYCDAALIEVLEPKDIFLSKSEYKARMLRFIVNVRDFYLRDAIIRVKGREATVSCISVISFRGRPFPKRRRRYLRCVKDREGWYIAEARYIA